MMTLTYHFLRPSFARDFSLRVWFHLLGLLSTLLLFVGLAGLTLLISGQRLTASPEVDLGIIRLPVSLALAGLFCAGLALNQWRAWQVKRLARQGWELLVAGRPEEAIRAFTVAISGGTGRTRVRSYEGLMLAWLRKGDYERVLALCGETWVCTATGDAWTTALHATVLALYGELEEARSWVREIRRPMFDKTDYALLAQTVVLCREGKYVEAVKRIQGTARENVLDTDVEAVAVLHAFARSRLGGQLVPLKPGCVLPEKPARASRYEYLACEWPELAAFLRGEAAPAQARGA